MSKEYSQYILDHRTNVQKAYLWLVTHELIEPELMSIVANNIAAHDMSKYQTEEYEAYDDYFYGKDKLGNFNTYNKKRQIDEAFNYAWLHHIHNNPHHWQYWVLINDEDGTKALEMPKEFIYEMISDWWAFSFKKGNLTEIFEWYKKNKKRQILHENTRKLVEEILDKIKAELDKK